MESTVIRIIRIVLILVVLGLLIWFIIWLFSPKGSDTPTAEEETSQTIPAEIYTNVQYVQAGEITAPEEHFSISITVSASSRTIQVYQGYEGVVVNSQTYTNDQSSYDAFYAALQQIGYFSERTPAQEVDRNSYCPLGIRYSYIAGNDLNNPNQNTWNSTCSSRNGTFGGNGGQARTLFKNQIPDYTTITKGVQL
jgi:hypothetical protein